MQRRWLGDALDFWKGSFLDVLRPSSSGATNVKIMPMFTDAVWSSTEIKTYADILGVPTTALMSTVQLTVTGRTRYSSACVGHVEDIFIDPDTGVAPNKPKLAHITAAEIVSLLTPKNVIAVYQHRPRNSPAAGWLKRYTALVAAKGVITMGYESAQVGMIFATQSPVREVAVRQSLSVRLGVVAAARGPIPGRIV